MTMGDIDLKSVNLNTLISVSGFLGTFVLVGIAWGATQSKLTDLEEWRQNHDHGHRDLQTQIASSHAAFDQRINIINNALSKVDQMEYRMAQHEKALEGLDVRVSRINESYSNQFADFRTQLSSISTQIALTNQTLQRMENMPRQSQGASQ